MARVQHAFVMTAAAILATQPCAAAPDPSSSSERRMSTFAGISMRMPLGQTGRERLSARLQLTTSFSVHDHRTGSVETLKAKGLEIGASRTGAPAFYLNGQSTAEIQKKLGIAGPEYNTVFIVVGVALIAVTVLVLTSGDGLPGPIV